MQGRRYAFPSKDHEYQKCFFTSSRAVFFFSTPDTFFFLQPSYAKRVRVPVFNSASGQRNVGARGTNLLRDLYSSIAPTSGIVRLLRESLTSPQVPISVGLHVRCSSPLAHVAASSIAAVASSLQQNVVLNACRLFVWKERILTFVSRN